MELFRKRKKLLVGLDIGSSSVKVCEMREVSGKNGKTYRLQKLGEVPLPPDAIIEGDIMDSNAVCEAIRTVVAEQKIKTKEVAISVSGQQVMVKKGTFPLMSENELAESVKWEADSFFPSGQGLDAHAFDYALLEQRPEDGNMDVLLVACRKDRLEAYMGCVAQAGLKAVVVDVDVFAVQNAYEINYPVQSRDEVVAVADVGARFTNLTISVGGRPVFWRDIMWGGKSYLEKLVEDWGVTLEGAEALLAGHTADGHSPEDVSPSVMAVSDNFADELMRTLDFFRSNFKVDRLDRIILSGGVAKSASLLEAVAARSRVSVERMNPFQMVDLESRSVDLDRVRTIGCSAAVAVGLAIRQAGDR